jgi:hypothetical protein
MITSHLLTCALKGFTAGDSLPSAPKGRRVFGDSGLSVTTRALQMSMVLSAIMDFVGNKIQPKTSSEGLPSAFGSLLLMREWSGSGGGYHLSDQSAMPALLVELQWKVLSVDVQLSKYS